MLSFGQRLKLLRKEADLSQTDLAEQLFVSVQSVSKWECDNAMPDIGQIVPLAAILGVTTDCLLGVGTDEKADREKCFDKIESIWEKYNGNSYENNVFFKSYEIYRNFLKKYPLAYDIKLCCANQIYYFFDYSIDGTRYQIPNEQEKALYNEAIRVLTSIMNRCNDPGYLMEARETLIALYLYKKEYEKAFSVAEELPKKYNIRERQLLDIYARKKDFEKALESANKICIEESFIYLESIFQRGRQISVFGNARKKEAIAAWYDLLDAAKLNYRMYGNEGSWSWIKQAYIMLSNDHIAISEFDKAFEIMNDFVDLHIEFFRWKKENPDYEHKDQFYVFGQKDQLTFYEPEWYMHQCYNWCFPTDDNIISKDPRYKACCEKLASAIAELNS